MEAVGLFRDRREMCEENKRRKLKIKKKIKKIKKIKKKKNTKALQQRV